MPQDSSSLSGSDEWANLSASLALRREVHPKLALIVSI